MPTDPNRLFAEVRTVRRIARALGGNQLATFLRFAHLRGPRKFSSTEIINLALLDPLITRSALKLYKSKEQAWPLYEAYNRHVDLILLNNKAKFQEICTARGLPTLPSSMSLRRDDVKQLLRRVTSGEMSAANDVLENLPDRFVAKPSFGLQGRGVRFYAKDPQGIQLLDGRRLSLTEFLESLYESLDAPATGSGAATGENVLLVQEIGLADPRIAEVSGSWIMQSLRICTVLDDAGQGSILFAFLKINAGGNLIDNFQKGATGNLLAYVDAANGRILRAIGRDSRLNLNRVLSHHPDTSAPLTGFEVPHWKEALALALRAASVFSGTRAVGWDIGITPTGPVLIEGNGTWDPVAPLYRALPKVKLK